MIVCAPTLVIDSVEVTFTTSSYLLKQKLFRLTRLEDSYVTVKPHTTTTQNK